MSRVGIWIANGLLAVVCCYLVAKIASEGASLWLEEPPSMVVGDAEGGIVAPKKTWDRRKVILDRNLFNVSTLAPKQPAPEPEEDLEKTKLPLKLLGTVAHSDPQFSWAAVQDMKQRDYQVVRLGDQLQGRAEVVGIERRRIVLDNNGRREELPLEENGVANLAVSRSKGRSGERRPARTAGAPRASAEELRERIQKLREAGKVARKADVRNPDPVPAAGRSPANLFSQARLLPKYDSGQMVGVQVSAIREGSLFERIGLSNGDTITELNGIQVTNPQESSAVLRELSEAEEYSVIVLGADGEERTISYTPEEDEELEE